MSITDINPGEVVIKKTEQSDDEDPSISGRNTSGIQTPFTVQTDQQQAQKPPPKDLKEFTLNKFNMLEPFMLK